MNDTTQDLEVTEILWSMHHYGFTTVLSTARQKGLLRIQGEKPSRVKQGSFGPVKYPVSHCIVKADEFLDKRKTGLTIKRNIKKDDQGFDSIEDFWNSGDESGHDETFELDMPYEPELQQAPLPRQHHYEDKYSPMTGYSCDYTFTTRPSYSTSDSYERPYSYRLSTGSSRLTPWGDTSSIEQARFLEGNISVSMAGQEEVTQCVNMPASSYQMNK
ncbi:hypothetical protein BGZ94_009194 [Podila epigama]|nr:hypothetical protein BGZ94_009194 [Podila epigama]